MDRERILMAAWMLPNTGDLTDAQRRQAIDNFSRYIDDLGIRSEDVAHEIGKPRKTKIDELRGHKFREGSDDAIRRLNMWVEQHARKKAASLDDEFVPTTKVALQMLGIAQLARDNNTISLAYGPTGIGKTRCAVAIHEKYIGSIYIRIIWGHHSPRGFIYAVANALGVAAPRATTKTNQGLLIERVIAVLQASDRMLIIDEAHKLGDEAIEVLRDLHDCTGVPVLLVATRDLSDRITRNADPDHGQLYSRVDIMYPLTKGYDIHSGGKPLHSIDDIRKLYNQPMLKLSRDAETYLQDVANTLGQGSLRRCKRLIQNAARRARKRQGKDADERIMVTADDLHYVACKLKPADDEKQQSAARKQKAIASVRTA